MVRNGKGGETVGYSTEAQIEGNANANGKAPHITGRKQTPVEADVAAARRPSPRPHDFTTPTEYAVVRSSRGPATRRRPPSSTTLRRREHVLGPADGRARVPRDRHALGFDGVLDVALEGPAAALRETSDDVHIIIL